MDWVLFVYRPLKRRALIGRIRTRGVPEQGRFTRADVDQLLALAWTSYREGEARPAEAADDEPHYEHAA